MNSTDFSYVLLVEDNENDILLIKRAFKKAGIACPLVVLKDGQEALNYLSEERASRPMLILLDLKLPKRSGHEVLQWVKERKLLRRVPVLVLTSSAQELDIARAYDTGANSYLVKPVKSDDLTALVELIRRYWLERNQAPLSTD